MDEKQVDLEIRRLKAKERLNKKKDQLKKLKAKTEPSILDKIVKFFDSL